MMRSPPSLASQAAGESLSVRNDLLVLLGVFPQSYCQNPHIRRPVPTLIFYTR